MIACVLLNISKNNSGLKGLTSFSKMRVDLAAQVCMLNRVHKS